MSNLWGISRFRRSLLRGLLASSLYGAYKSAWPIDFSKRKMFDTNPSEEEMALLNDASARRKKYGQQPMLIRDRKFTAAHHIASDSVVDNVIFDNCNFVDHQMNGVILENVKFVACRFLRATWDNGSISSITMDECEFHGGDNEISASKTSGYSKFSRCKFIGFEDNGKKGSVIAPGDCDFIDCDFLLMSISSVRKMGLKSCKLRSVDVIGISKSNLGEISMESCQGDSISLYAEFSTISVEGSSIAKIKLARTSSKSIKVADSKCELALLGASTKQLTISNTTLFSGAPTVNVKDGGGLTAEQVDIGNMTVTDCRFEGINANFFAPGSAPKLNSKGEVIVRKGADGTLIPYHATIGRLTWKNTPMQRADLRYADIGTLSIEGSTVSDSQFMNAEIGELALKNVRLAGQVDFSNAKVKKLSSAGVTRDPGLKLVKTGTDLQL